MIGEAILGFLDFQSYFHHNVHRSCRNTSNWNGYHDYCPKFGWIAHGLCCLHHACRLVVVSRHMFQNVIFQVIHKDEIIFLGNDSVRLLT